MDSEPRTLMSGTGKWLYWADIQGVRQGASASSSTSSAATTAGGAMPFREPIVPDPTGANSVIQQVFAITAYAQAMLIADAGGRCGEFGLRVDRVNALDPEGRIVPRSSLTTEADGEIVNATRGAAPPKVAQPHDYLTTGLRS